jgi:WD40 repeat protein
MFVGLGCSDGVIRVMSSSKGNFLIKKGNVQYVLRNIDHSPVSCLALNPNSTNIKNAIMTTHVDGTLEYWHATSQQLLFSKKVIFT